MEEFVHVPIPEQRRRRLFMSTMKLVETYKFNHVQPNTPLTFYDTAINTAYDICNYTLLPFIYAAMKRYGLRRYTVTGKEINKWLCALYVYRYETRLLKIRSDIKCTIAHTPECLKFIKQKFRDSLIND